MSTYERRRQQLNLVRWHTECELNYCRIYRLVPDLDQCERQVRINYLDNPKTGISVRILERTRYTSLLSIDADGAGPCWLPGIEIKVRIYRDARMAEVIEWCSDRTIPWALCERPGMQSRDEKWQWNWYLSELLSHTLKHGMVDVELDL